MTWTFWVFLGSVRLEEARKHQNKANELKKLAGTVDDKDPLQKLKQDIRNESQGYSQLKKARRAVLTNSRNLSESGGEALDEILNTHSDLATCYAMKEEMNRLFELRDKKKPITDGWNGLRLRRKVEYRNFRNLQSWKKDVWEDR